MLRITDAKKSRLVNIPPEAVEHIEIFKNAIEIDELEPVVPMLDGVGG